MDWTDSFKENPNNRWKIPALKSLSTLQEPSKRTRIIGLGRNIPHMIDISQFPDATHVLIAVLALFSQRVSEHTCQDQFKSTSRLLNTYAKVVRHMQTLEA